MRIAWPVGFSDDEASLWSPSMVVGFAFYGHPVGHLCQFNLDNM